ncbi:TetR/AcrR family transcriptional regulator [Salinispora tropica]|uniref:Regulatory protein, TetR n=1 Tax=Salinispora tropica (strain ATCC BAA-916 / DSM 44818 / JCM 13857 / NBRC 105044 / CNB-440) TaxID=369723 RepID=A4XAZ6_SALTO|nr:TetR/AcrR family transcriptional regulator [Salinispora tropica]ABP56095.1 regulatory protein, TetR [Salinispora tropica CNB-440]
MTRAVPERHDNILAAAGRRFAQSGYRGTSLQDIAADVGCSKAAVLYHFADKKAILAELVARPIDQLRELDERIAAASSPAEAQRVAAEGYVDLAVQFRRETAFLRGEFPGLLEHPPFDHLQHVPERLVRAFAGHSDRPAARVAALVVLAGIAETCGEFIDLPDSELRPALLALVRRALEPVT